MEQQFSTLDRTTMLELMQHLSDGEEFLLQVTGWSMMPLLFHNRSMVCLKRVSPYQPRKGDIVLFFRLDGSVVLHRVKKIEKNGFLLINGDAQSWTEHISPVQVAAVVVSFVRRKRNVSVEHPMYRLYKTLWVPLRPLHPLGAKLVYYWHRVPEKLFGKTKK